MARSPLLLRLSLLRASIGVVLYAILGLAVAVPTAAQSDIRIHGNHTAAGKLDGGVLTLALETGVGNWRFNGDDKPGIQVQAFAEAGGPLQIPGPMIRVPAGTEIQLSIRHAAAGSGKLVMHGLFDRPAARDAPVEIAPGETGSVRFRLSTPGTYYYWGSTTGKPLTDRFGVDSQLHGAIIVDALGVAPDTKERVFIISEWLDAYRTNGAPAFAAAQATINGRSWPATERLEYTQGETIRWRWINLSFENHPMHLHGFYFRINGRSDLLRSETYRKSADRHWVNTDWLQVGETRTISWSAPNRPGRWVVHCHNPYHMRSNFPLESLQSRSFPFRGTPEFDKLLESTRDMGGMVLGVTIHPKHGKHPVEPREPRRKLELSAEEAPDSTAAVKSYRYMLSGVTDPSEGMRGANLLIVLTRGEPVEIVVRNRLREHTTVHWHGIELASYYDGVHDFGGDARRQVPMIHPGESFAVRFTPPRAGTFIYHTHMNDAEQQEAGLSGPLIVLRPGQKYDPKRDHIVLVTSPPNLQDQGKFALVNGVNPPAPLMLKAGQRHRLRIINVHSFEVNLSVELKRGAELATWRPLAKDGRDLPAPRRGARKASQLVSLGETYDFAFTPAKEGEYALELSNKQFKKVLNTIPVRVLR